MDVLGAVSKQATLKPSAGQSSKCVWQVNRHLPMLVVAMQSGISTKRSDSATIWIYTIQY